MTPNNQDPKAPVRGRVEVSPDGDIMFVEVKKARDFQEMIVNNNSLEYANAEQNKHDIRNASPDSLMELKITANSPLKVISVRVISAAGQ